MAPTGPRDELYTDAHGLAGGNKTMLEPADASTLIEDFIDDSSNLPLELKRMNDELSERRDRVEALQKVVNQRESSLQKWIRTQGSHVPNPKEAEYRKVIEEAQKKMHEILEENVMKGTEMGKLLDRRILALDKGIKKLIDRGDIPEDPELPSLLRPPMIRPPVQADGAADLSNSEFLQSPVPPAPPYRSAGRSSAGVPLGHRTVPQQNSAGMPGLTVTVGSLSGLPNAGTAQKSRESSAGAPNKRPRMTGSLAIPQVSGNLARQTSLGPGTPKGQMSSSSRAGSAGPRPSKTGSAVTKRVGPPKARKSHLNKSSIHRIGRAHNGGSPSSNNDDEYLDGEGGSPEDGAATSPRHRRRGGDLAMLEGDEEDVDDNAKWCICETGSFGDMVQCDNANCPYEWFHWGCVGLTKAPADHSTWYCDTPACNSTTRVARPPVKK